MPKATDGAPDKRKRSKAKPKAGQTKTAKRRRATKTKAQQSIAQRAETQAKRAPKGAHLSRAEERLRNGAIRGRAAQGRSTTEIAEEFHVSKRTVERVLSSSEPVDSPLGKSAIRLVRELADGFQRDIGDFEAMAAMASTPAAGPNWPVALGSKKAAHEARKDLAWLMQQLGRLPMDLAHMRTAIDAHQIGSAMVEAVEAFEESIDRLPLDDEQQAAIADAAANLRAAFAELIGDEDEVIEGVPEELSA